MLQFAEGNKTDQFRGNGNVRPGPRRLGEYLIDRGLVDETQLQAALAAARQCGKKLGQMLIELGALDPQTLAEELSAHLDVPLVDLQAYRISADVLALVPEHVARRYRVLPIACQGDTIVIATGDPQDVVMLEDLRARLKMRVKPALALEAGLDEAINLYYRANGEIERQLSQLSPAPAAASITIGERVSQETITASPMVRAVDLLLAQAAKDRASDVHLEPGPGGVRVRYRIDGLLQEVMTLPASVHGPMLSRIKVMAGMNIAERRRPQDGQFTVKVDQRDLDVRVATIESANGEMIVMRLLDKSMSVMNLTDLGFQPDPLRSLQRMLKAPYGAILCAGPTGAGKTTTLYAALNFLDHKERKVITIEDPVEYRFPDISQIQVNRLADITFASGLRAVMRLDPDVILVGEIRDRETAEIAIHAALTGHLVLSSIHANDAIGAMFRLLDLGVDPLLVTSAVIGAVSQRLVRRIDDRCREDYEPSMEELLAYREEMGEERTHFQRGTGCNLCARTGYSGRTAVCEVLTLGENLRSRFLKGATHGDARQAAVDEGFIPMLRDGMMKARDGQTTLGEVVRTVVLL